MANRILVDVEESCPVPPWIENVEPFLQKLFALCAYDGEECSVFFCSDAYIQNLNREYRNIDEATDVLSFESGDSYKDEDGNTWLSIGDIAISLDMLPKNAAYFEVPEDEELKRLLVHGVLHLHGYDHGEEHVQKDVEPQCEMLKKQKLLLAALAGEEVKPK